MFKKVRLRLTVLFIGITAAIMITMSLCYLYVSEASLQKNQYASFRSDINTIVTNLEQLSVISMEWIAKMEAQKNYTFFFLDNDVPFLYNRLSNFQPFSANQVLLQECLDAYYSHFSISVVPTENPVTSPYVSYHVEDEFYSSSRNQDFFYSYICMEKNSSYLQVIILSPQNILQEQILRQRIVFLLIDITALIFLSLFSYFFTGKLLKPIAESQIKQNQFIAAASHELRTPLAVILSSAECCQKTKTENQDDFLSIIQREGNSMKALINDMLTLSTSDNCMLSINPKPTELDTLLLNSYEAFEPLAKKEQLTLSVNLPKETLPPCFCDENRIRQVVSILLHNAISYTPAGGFIKLALSFQKEWFSITVSDNGIGISDADKKKIFDRFYRAEKARSTKGHFGLGLSIAFEIIKLHHGSLTVEDAPVKGTVFTVRLPRA